VIRVSGLSKSVQRPGGLRHAILRDVSLTVPSGCLYGRGKSVLLKMMTALIKPDRGTVEVGGHSVTAASELKVQEIRKGIGMLCRMYRGELIFDGTTAEARSCDEPRVSQFVHGLTEGPL
jgi:ABC-type transporter Mla maintaining outer membrane lipid asymmetry ATPase subunit MlaF